MNEIKTRFSWLLYVSVEKRQAKEEVHNKVVKNQYWIYSNFTQRCGVFSIVPSRKYDDCLFIVYEICLQGMKSTNVIKWQQHLSEVDSILHN